MATIVFFPFPEFGHLNPTLKLARALKSRGHRVCYIGLADFQEYFRSQGLEFFTILEDRYPKGSSGQRSAQMKLGRVELIMRETMKADDKASSRPFQGVKKEVGAILREINPDLLIVDFLIGGLAYIASQEFGVASAVLSVTLLEGWMLGEPTDDSAHEELPVLVLCPEEFDFRNGQRKRNRYYIEPSVDLQRKELGDFPWQSLDPDKPLIYCSVGCQPHLYSQSSSFYRAVIEAMRAKPDWQLVLAVGRHIDCTTFHPLPPNVLLVNWAPQLELIKKASIMITHGGLGGVKECILLGVPMVVYPCRWDQPFNAARVVAHGLGVRGNINTVTAEQVGTLIETVAGNPQYKRRVAEMSRVFNRIEHSGKGVNAVETILAGAESRRAKLNRTSQEVGISLESPTGHFEPGPVLSGLGK